MLSNEIIDKIEQLEHSDIVKLAQTSKKIDSYIRNKNKTINDLSKTEFVDFVTGKIIVVMNGCFCPPHFGHYLSFIRAIEEIQEKQKIKVDILLLTTTNNSDHPRHGTPVEHTVETLERWGRKIKGVDVLVGSSLPHPNPGVNWSTHTKNFISFNMPDTVKRIYEVRVLEGVSEIPKQFTPSINTGGFHRLRQTRISEFEWISDKVLDYFMIREDDGYSATKFTQCLKDETQDCLYFVGDVDDESYISNIRQKYGKNLK